ncbi:MAG: class I SAM-dependent methyltransferase [Candidatus Omnitrophica bacterium]|nr:class I SAM-dependent methyltransferase [Candidatus Omnitrophota bacterium]
MDYDRGGRQKEIYSESDVISVCCPFCNINKYRQIYQERGTLAIVKCLGCGLLYVNPRLKEPEKIYWGEADKYFKEARLIFEGKSRHHRDQNYIQDLKLIYKYKPSGNFLDVGTNMGFFLRNAKGWSWNLYGVEPSSSLSEIARKYFSLNVKTAFLQDAGFKNSFFDVVTMTDVFEHLSEPGEVLEEVKRILKPDGILFIKVPNGLFNLFKYYCAKTTNRLKNYDIFDSYEHVVHYSQKTLKLMLDKFGFKVIRVCIGRPIQVPVWHNYVGHYYQYPTPWMLDCKRQFARITLYLLSLIEYRIRLNRVGYLAPNIVVIAKKSS